MALKAKVVSYWKLDESSGNPADSVGSNTLTNNNTVTFGAAKINNGATFVRTSSQYFSITDGAQTGLDLNGSGDCSFMFWVNLTSLPSTPAESFWIISKDSDDANAHRGYGVLVNTSNKLDCFYSDGAGNFTEYTMDTAFVSGDLGTWIHIAAVFNVSAHTITFYKNRVLMSGTATSSAATSINNNAQPFQLSGQSQSGPSVHFLNGSLDAVGVYNKALEIGEVSADYNKGNGSQHPWSGIIQPDASAIGLTSSTGSLTFNLVVTLDSHTGADFYGFTRDGDFGNGLTVDGVAATLVQKQNTRNSRWEYHYRIVGLTAGTKSVAFATTGTPGRTECVARSLVEVAQTTTPDATAFITNSSANPFVASITTIADNAWITAGVDTGTSGQSSASATLLQDNTPTGAMILYDNSVAAPAHPAGSTTLNIGNSGTGADIALMASWAPYVASVARPDLLLGLI